MFLSVLEGPLGLPKFCSVLVIPSNSRCPGSSPAHNAETRVSLCVGTNWTGVVVSRSTQMVSRGLQGLTFESLLIVHTVLSPFQPALGAFFYHQTSIDFQLEASHSRVPEY